MNTHELALLSMHELAGLVRRREVRVTELVQGYLARIDELDAQLNSYITVCREEALSAAAACDSEIEKGNYRGPLHGMPIALKDQLYTKGIRTTNGSYVFKDFIPEQDATVVRKLKDAGAVILGKLNMSEFAIGGTRQFPFGTPRNPWNVEYTTGESSAGSGAAVAASLCAASLGEDTGGSGRYPASACGIVGLRATLGRISRVGMRSLSWSCDMVAPMARTVRDCALLTNVIAGDDPEDPVSVDIPVPDYTSELDLGVRGMKIGVIRELFAEGAVSGEVRLAIENALAVYRGLGATVVEVSVPAARLAAEIFVCTGDVDCGVALRDILRDHAAALDSQTRIRLTSALLGSASMYQTAQKARNLLARQMREALKSVDVLVSATIPDPPQTIASIQETFDSAPDAVRRMYRVRSSFMVYPLARLPAVSVPCGFSKIGLPLGLQIGGRSFEEGTILRVAQALESATDFHTRRPPVS